MLAPSKLPHQSKSMSIARWGDECRNAHVSGEEGRGMPAMRPPPLQPPKPSQMHPRSLQKPRAAKGLGRRQQKAVKEVRSPARPRDAQSFADQAAHWTASSLLLLSLSLLIVIIPIFTIVTTILLLLVISIIIGGNNRLGSSGALYCSTPSEYRLRKMQESAKFLHETSYSVESRGRGVRAPANPAQLLKR